MGWPALDDPALFVRLVGHRLRLGGDERLAAETRAAIARIGAALGDSEVRRAFEASEQRRALDPFVG